MVKLRVGIHSVERQRWVETRFLRAEARRQRLTCRKAVGFTGNSGGNNACGMEWKLASEVPELTAAMANSPPPLLSKARAYSPRGGRIAALVALAISVGAIATLSTIVYGNSAEGIASLVGEFVGGGAVAALIFLTWWRTGYSVALILVIATATLFSSNASKISEGLAARRAIASLHGVTDVQAD